MTESKPTLKPGASVVCPLFQGAGSVLDGPNGKAEYLIGVGSLKMWIHESKLAASAPPKAGKQKAAKPIASQSDSSDQGSIRIDLHGLPAHDAVIELERAIDQALLKGVGRIEVIHGIGGGILKGAVDKYLASSPHIGSFKLDERNPGTTWVFI